MADRQRLQDPGRKQVTATGLAKLDHRSTKAIKRLIAKVGLSVFRPQDLIMKSETSRDLRPHFYGTVMVRWARIHGAGVYWQRFCVLEDDSAESLRRRIRLSEDLGWTETTDNAYIRGGLHPDSALPRRSGAV